MPRPFERRQTAAYPYFKIATWDRVALTFVDGKRAFATEAEARAAAKHPGRYRVSEIGDRGRRDLESFDVPPH